MSKSGKGAFLIAIAILIFASCKRTDNTSPYFNSDDNGGYASDASRIELATDDVISMADAAGTTYSPFYIADSSTLITVAVDTPAGQVHQLTIRFGENDVLCLDGRNRRGTITIQYSGRYTDSLQPHTITFTNYFINENQLSGSIIVTRIDTTVAGDYYYLVKVADSLNMYQAPVNSQPITWDGSLVRRWISGYNTGTRSDDKFSISGAVNLVRANGNAYSYSIGTPLQVALDCNYVESGVVTVSGYIGSRVLNYGSGNCDPNAQVTLAQDNSIYNITLTP